MSAAKYAFLDIDLAFSQIGDAEVMTGMLQMLQDALPRDLPQIADLLQAGDVAGANRLLHSLKGFIPIFCVADLCNEVAQVEGLSKDSRSVAAAPAYAELQPKLQTLLAEVSDYLQQQTHTG